ncbi:MAG: hypothetical protein GF346_12905, partial [Candidatus Eisenbacteria bacterium]|nr:hypothetical protein [Candidatus Latescibacterota bacterium]MBD3303337.1 hypothetical protein [Candidatus Eisenbacteria bacterium]
DLQISESGLFAAASGPGGALVLTADDEAGTSWSETAPLPDEDLIGARALGLGPTGELLAGGERAWGKTTTVAYSSIDGGASWVSLGGSFDLANAVHAFALRGELVYAATGDLFGNVYACTYERPSDVDSPDVEGVRGPLLLQVGPNPSSGPVEIGYRREGPRALQLEIFDSTGRLVRRLATGEVPKGGAGMLTWDGRDDAGREVAAGVYAVRAINGRHEATRRIVRIR